MVTGEEPQFGERVEDHSGWLRALHLFEHRPDRLAELHFGRIKDGVLLLRPQAFLSGGELA